MRPDKCSEYEPIRRPFDASDISKPIEWLASTGGVFLYRKGKPIQVSGVMWNLSRSPTARFPTPPFSNYWTGEFDGKWANQVGLKNVEDFVFEMFQVTKSDFGFLSTEADLKAKNTIPTSFSYKGMALESGIPGLYWINFFSDKLADWLDLNRFPNELAMPTRLRNGGVTLKFCESPEESRTLEVLQKQRAAIEWFGAEKFFDIHFPDRKAETPDW